MITKQDLGKIGNLIDTKLDPIKKGVTQLQVDVSGLKKDVSSLKADVSELKEDVVHIRKDQKTIIRFFDREYLDLRKRVESIERFLKFSSEVN